MLVGECGVDAAYFMYEMCPWEANLIYEGYKRKKYESWKRTQILGWLMLQPHMTKKLKPEDVLAIDHILENNDEDDTEENKTEERRDLTQSEVNERAKLLAQHYMK